LLSLPSWERGLKCNLCIIHLMLDASLPSWERGLKSEVFRPHRRTFRVAPFVGAWIEIWETLNKKGFVFVAPFVGAWIEISIGTSFAMIADCRSLRGSVD